MQTVEVRTYDLLVVGGGIAGISIAERLAREAARQGRILRTLLVDKESILGAGSSSGLEGWYHGGALYSKLREPRHFFVCVNALEDLYNWYALDPAFTGRARCNLEALNASNAAPSYLLQGGTGNWFVSPITYVLFRDLHIPKLDIGKATLDARYDKQEWDETRRRVIDLVGRTFFGVEEGTWCNAQLTCCQAPHVAMNADHPIHHFADVVSRLRASRNPRDGGRATALAERQAEFECWPVLTDSPRDVVPSCDGVMRTGQIVQDLAASAAGNGVEMLGGWKLEDEASLHVSRYGSPNVTGVLLTGPDKERLHVIATQYVFAMGGEFNEEGLLRRALDLRVRVEKKTSVMLVASPALWDKSWVRMHHYPRADFNHLYHPGDQGEGYSVVADSHALPVDATDGACARHAEELVAKVVRYSCSAREGRRFGWYRCEKTEFPIDESTDREYAYYFGPRLFEFDSDKWMNDRGEAQKRVQDEIMAVVMGSGRERPERPIAESHWALKKLLHFALLREIHGESSTAGNAGGAQGIRFEDARERAIASYTAHYKAGSPPQPNFLCVVPGKFSLFPTLAHQVYLEMEVRQLFSKLRPGRAPAREPLTVSMTRAEALIRKMKQATAGTR